MGRSCALLLLHTTLLFSCTMLITLPTLMKCWASAATTSHGNDTDEHSLLAFKAHIAHDPLRVLSSWNSTIHFCKWHGVTCGRRHQRMVRLDLGSSSLVGSLSPYIGNLTFLHSINLENNSFFGEIPSEVGHLFRLNELRMSNNSFTGEIPCNLSRCSNLITISIGYNNLSGTIPVELGSLKKLVILDLQQNNIIGKIPHSIGNLSSLELIRFTYNNLDGRIPDSLGQLKSLKLLGLGANMLSSLVPSSVYNLSLLQGLSVAGNQLVDKLPPNVGLTLPNLRKFYIGANQFYGSLPLSLVNMSTLQILDFGANNFTGQIPSNVESLLNLQALKVGVNHLGSGGQVDDLKFLSCLVNCSNLQMIDVDSNQLGGTLQKSFPKNISSIQLKALYLEINQISGTIPSEIENLVNLKALHLKQNHLSGSIPKGIGKLRNLQRLLLGRNELSGKIPFYNLNNLSQLYFLDLSYNNFEGDNALNVNNFPSLSYLDLFGSNLNGTLQQVLGQSSHELLNVNLANNSFTGSLPPEVGSFQDLIVLDISNNQLTGEIPNALGKCFSLQQLSLMDNSFQGSIPPSFSSLQGLQCLDLSLNNLSGEIPMFLQNLSSSLQYLDLSFNNFEGAVPTEGVFRNASAFSILGNKKLCGGIPKLQLPTCPDKQKHSKKHQMPLYLKVAIGVIGSCIVLATLLLAICWMRRPKNGIETQMNLHDRYERVSFLDLHRATDGFSPANLIGAGHFGSIFKGIIREGAEPVAVKVLNMIDHKASKSFMAECEALRNVQHRNLMKILTACSTVDFQGNDFKALIFKFMPNGSLENRLHAIISDGSYLPENLNLPQRINIAIDIASALDYLHNQCETPIIHCDLKPSNVLLDEDMVAYVGDFGLAKFLQRKNNNSGTKSTTSSFSPRGTVGYIPPEYGIGVEVSKQGDMYSYGVLLLEIFTGKRPTDEVFEDGLDLHKFCKFALHKQVMKIIDPHMLKLKPEASDHQDIRAINFEIQRGIRHESGRVEECISSIIKVGVECSMPSPSERMDIKDALKELLVAKKLYVQDI